MDINGHIAAYKQLLSASGETITWHRPGAESEGAFGEETIGAGEDLDITAIVKNANIESGAVRSGFLEAGDFVAAIAGDTVSIALEARLTVRSKKCRLVGINENVLAIKRELYLKIER